MYEPVANKRCSKGLPGSWQAPHRRNSQYGATLCRTQKNSEETWIYLIGYLFKSCVPKTSFANFSNYLSQLGPRGMEECRKMSEASSKAGDSEWEMTLGHFYMMLAHHPPHTPPGRCTAASLGHHTTQGQEQH